MRPFKSRTGNATLEFTLVGLPLICVLFSIASMCFGMFTLHTMQEAVEQATRLVITHGSTCSSGTNTCTITVGTIADAVASAAPGIINSALNLTLIPNSGTANETTCNPVTSCHGNATVWPPSSNGDNTPGNNITLSADFSYTSPIAMFWPGSQSSHFGAITFHSTSQQRLMF